MSDKPGYPPFSRLDWLPCDPDEVWEDGERIFAAVLVHSGETGKQEWQYDMVTITLSEADDDDLITAMPEVDGHRWSWDLEDIDWFVEIRG